MEVLANTAVAEICKLVDDGYAVLRLEVSDSREENEALKRKLQLMEMRLAREACVSSRPERTKVCTVLRPSVRDGDPLPGARKVFRKRKERPLTKDGKADGTTLDVDNTPIRPVDTLDECLDLEEERAESLLVKEEKKEEESDLHKGPHFHGDAAELGANGRGRSPALDSGTGPRKGLDKITDPEQHGSRRGGWECTGMEEGRTGSVLIKEERVEEDRETQGEMNSRVERILDSDLDGVDVGKAANRLEEQRVFWEASGQEVVLGEEPKSLCVAGVQKWVEPEQRAECVMFEGRGQSGAYFSPGGSDRDFLGAGDPGGPYGFGGGLLGSQAPAELHVITEDPMVSLEPLGWKADSATITQEICLPHTQRTGQPNVDSAEGSGCGPSDVQSSGGTRVGVGGKQKRFFCSFCGKGFSFPKQVEIHQRVHTGEKPFSCTQCRQRFSHAGNLKRHQRVHTGEKPFSCTLCDKRFSHLHQLKMHQRIHSGERPFACTSRGLMHACATSGDSQERSYLRWIHQQVD
ncbi:hypothetical protein GJAV_G00248780 [Gymnothorax javanicus]|nr:hypothetical protein GJAV_G00248780 [Gymnothorax javanicus]